VRRVVGADVVLIDVHGHPLGEQVETEFCDVRAVVRARDCAGDNQTSARHRRAELRAREVEREQVHPLDGPVLTVVRDNAPACLRSKSKLPRLGAPDICWDVAGSPALLRVHLGDDRSERINDERGGLQVRLEDDSRENAAVVRERTGEQGDIQDVDTGGCCPSEDDAAVLNRHLGSSDAAELGGIREDVQRVPVDQARSAHDVRAPLAGA
jgi:hypothetical protein